MFEGLWQGQWDRLDVRREWPIPEKEPPEHKYGWRGFDKGHKRDRVAAKRREAWQAACEVSVSPLNRFPSNVVGHRSVEFSLQHLRTQKR